MSPTIAVHIWVSRLWAHIKHIQTPPHGPHGAWSILWDQRDRVHEFLGCAAQLYWTAQPEVDGPGQWLMAGCKKSIVEALRIAICSPVAWWLNVVGMFWASKKDSVYCFLMFFDLELALPPSLLFHQFPSSFEVAPAPDTRALPWHLQLSAHGFSTKPRR